ncbi:unnamed protein product [Nippostrongylus brasiliensis]|uniref:Uncharacterized protein n=1 Tax=Nippostrongylus brasiliensis TaxID=27835 RepID=A0A0N4XSJ1_NIPBR|nr:unnamed protein product [Nippostrongylus brasiliensis]
MSNFFRNRHLGLMSQRNYRLSLSTESPRSQWTSPVIKVFSNEFFCTHTEAKVWP